MSQVYGFRGYQPRAQTYVNPFTGAVIATPVLDLSSVRGPAGYADRSATGANGAPIGAPANARGVFDEAIKFGAFGNALNCGSNAPLDVAGDISVGCWASILSIASVSYIMYKTVFGGLGYVLTLDGTGGGAPGCMRVYSGALATIIVGATSNFGAFRHLFFTASGAVIRLFVDGLQDARGALASNLNDPAANLMISGTAISFAGSIELPQVYNGALSPEQVYRNYLLAKDVPIYYDTFESYAVTPVAKAAGSMCGPYRVLANTMSIVVDVAGKKWVVGASAGLYGEGMSNWPELAGYGTWDIDMRRDIAALDWYYSFFLSAPGYTVGQGYMLVVTSNGAVSLWRDNAGAVVALFTTANGVTSAGVDYTFRIVRRVGGQFAVYVKGGVYPDFALLNTPVTDNTYTSGTYHGPLLLTSGTDRSRIGTVKLTRVCERPASFPWEFSTGTYAGLVSGSTIWMRCLTAGVTYLPKDLDWQTCTFGLYKGGGANVTDVLFVASEIGGSTFANQNGYVLRVAADESVQLIRTTAGVEAAPTAQTAAGYVALTTEYQIKITHNGTTNAYEFYIMGGAYTTWTLMFAATLGIHTSSNYHVTDLDGDDRTTAPSFYTDLR
jgi:hypothetical protein